MATAGSYGSEEPEKQTTASSASSSSKWRYIVGGLWAAYIVALLAKAVTVILIRADLLEDKTSTFDNGVVVASTLPAVFVAEVTVVVGFATSLFGTVVHLRSWTQVSKWSSVALGLVSSFMELLALGMAAKQWEQASDLAGSLELEDKLHVLSAFVILSVILVVAVVVVTIATPVSALFAFNAGSSKKAEFGLARKMMLMAAGISTVLYVTRAALAGDFQEDVIDGELSFGADARFNRVSPLVIGNTLIASSVGFAFSGACVLHALRWNAGSQHLVFAVGALVGLLNLWSGIYSVASWATENDFDTTFHFINVFNVFHTLLHPVFIVVAVMKTAGFASVDPSGPAPSFPPQALSRKAVPMLAGLSAILYIVRMSIASKALDDMFEGDLSVSSDHDINAATPFLVNFSLIAAMVGFASVTLVGLHSYVWNGVTGTFGAGLSVVACTVDLYAAGYAIKQWEIENAGYGWQIFGFLAVFQVLLQMMLIMGTMKFVGGYNASGTGAPLASEEDEADEYTFVDESSNAGNYEGDYQYSGDESAYSSS